MYVQKEKECVNKPSPETSRKERERERERERYLVK